LTPIKPKYNIWKFAKTHKRMTSGTHRLKVQVEKEKKGSGAMGIGYFHFDWEIYLKECPSGISS
jgi:hypothetical protein